MGGVLTILSLVSKLCTYAWDQWFSSEARRRQFEKKEAIQETKAEDLKHLYDRIDKEKRDDEDITHSFGR